MNIQQQQQLCLDLLAANHNQSLWATMFSAQNNARIESLQNAELNMLLLQAAMYSQCNPGGYPTSNNNLIDQVSMPPLMRLADNNSAVDFRHLPASCEIDQQVGSIALPSIAATPKQTTMSTNTMTYWQKLMALTTLKDKHHQKPGMMADHTTNGDCSVTRPACNQIQPVLLPPSSPLLIAAANQTAQHVIKADTPMSNELDLRSENGNKSSSPVQASAISSASRRMPKDAIERRRCHQCWKIVNPNKPMSALLNHAKRHYPLKQFRCAQCNYSSSESAHVRNHMRLRHDLTDMHPTDVKSPVMQNAWIHVAARCFPSMADELKGFRFKNFPKRKGRIVAYSASSVCSGSSSDFGSDSS